MDPHPLPRDSLKRKLDAANDADDSHIPSSPTAPPKRLRLALPPSSSPSPSSSSSSSSSTSPVRPQAPHYALRPALVVQTPSPVSPAIASPSIPSSPPITRETLRELDLDAILRNPQLRHDLLFDPNLQFRPTAGRRKQAMADRYWAALAQELTTTSAHRRPRPPTPPPWSPRYPPPHEQESAADPQRVPKMLHEFRALLAAVLVPAPVPVAAPAPAPAPPPSDDADALLAHIRPALIAQELSRGIYDPAGLFRVMADVLKRHCAPMRDHLVDEMLRVASSPAPAPAIRTLHALRLAFSLLELMKLDIANHQLHHLRPFLARSSPDFELRTFLTAAAADPASLLRARRWLRPILPPPPLTRPHVHHALLHALAHLVFPDPATPAPIPTTLALDLPRLALLRRDAADLSALYLLLMLARAIAPPPSSRTAAPTSADVDRLKRAIWAVGPRRIGACFYQEPKLHQAQVEDPLPAPGAEAEQDWEGVILQIALAATSPSSSSTLASNPTHNAPLPAPHTLALLRGWVHTHMRAASPLAARLRAILRDAVCARCVGADPALAALNIPPHNVDPADLHASVSSSSLGMHATPQSQGLEPLAPELAHLAARVEKLAHVHVGVYWSFYAAGKADDGEEGGEEGEGEEEGEEDGEDGAEDNE